MYLNGDWLMETTIRHNRIYRCNRGLWLDWMGQGSQVSGNLMHDNGDDIFLEMQHGPLLLANNVLLSKWALNLDSEGIAFAQNLITGGILVRYGDKRTTPFQGPHDTTIVGMYPSPNGDRGITGFTTTFSPASGMAAFSTAASFPVLPPVMFTPRARSRPRSTPRR